MHFRALRGFTLASVIAAMLGFNLSQSATASDATDKEPFTITISNNDQLKAGKPAPSSAQSPRRSATRADGRAVGRATGSHSYVNPADTETRKLIESVGNTEQNGRLAQQDPPQSILERCRNDPRADGGKGHVFNRLWWCQDHGFTAQGWNTSGELIGEAKLNYLAIAWGSHNSRDILVEFKQTFVGDNWGVFEDEDDVVFDVGATCADTGTNNGCAVHYDRVAQTMTEWEENDEWRNWLITSDETKSTSPDKVLRHLWNLTAAVRVDGGAGPTVRTPWHLIRCDSATYFPNRPLACINDDVLPYITYQINSPAAVSVHDVAVHIRQAQDTPNLTYPPSGTPKRIPGKYVPENPQDNGLHRIPTSEDGPNRAEVRRACNGLSPIPSDDQCDEYPFASTQEGAASPVWDYSVKAVDGAQNARAGSYLRWYYFYDRMLYKDMDSYYVNIID
ncbi:NucA/NucB deoxyribonuclease domain-containing protein [Streptomyces sp. NPDC003032]